MRQTPARLHQQLDGVVEVRGIAAVGSDDREELLDIFAKQQRLQQRLPGVHPVDIALERVDFAIVRDVVIGMSALPTRKSVGRKTLMHQAQRAGHVRVG